MCVLQSFCNTHILYLLNLGQIHKAFCQFLVGGLVVLHFSVVELFIGIHIKVARTGQTKDNGLFLAGFLTLGGTTEPSLCPFTAPSHYTRHCEAQCAVAVSKYPREN